MGFDINSMGDAFGGSGGRTFARSLPVKVERFETAGDDPLRHYCIGTVVGGDGRFEAGVAAKVWLSPTDNKSRRTLKDLERKVKSGGIIRFDKVREESDGTVSAHWPVILSHRQGEYEVAVEWMRVVLVRKAGASDKLFLEVVFPGRRELPENMAQLEAILVRQFGASIPGVPRSVLRISTGDARDAQMLMPKFTESGAPASPEESVAQFLASRAAKFVQGAFEASARVELIPATTSILMGQDTQSRQEKAGQLPDRWFKMAGGEPGFALSSASLGKRGTGGWMFIEAKPLVVPADLVSLRDLPGV